MNEINQKARDLRKKMTLQERKLWQYLRNRSLNNCRFRRQFPIGKYIVDFVCREKKLIIEVDGGQHNEENTVIYDAKRSEFLEKQGYKVLRFWNNDIDNNMDGVYVEILKYLS